MVDERGVDPAAPLEGEARPDVDADRARVDEAVDEVLGERAVDLRGPPRGALEAVDARVVDVDVEPGLVRRVAQAP